MIIDIASAVFYVLFFVILIVDCIILPIYLVIMATIEAKRDGKSVLEVIKYYL